MSYITEGFQSVGYFPTPHFGIAIYPPSLGNVCTLRVQLHNLIINHPEKKEKQYYSNCSAVTPRDAKN